MKIDIHRVTCVKFPNILNINFSIYGKPMQMKIQNRTVKPKFISDGLYLCAAPGNLWRALSFYRCSCSFLLSHFLFSHFCSLSLFLILSLSHRTHTVHTSHLIHRASCIVLHNIHIAFALRIREIDLRFYLCTFFKCIVYFALTVDWKLEIDKFNIIDVIFLVFYSIAHRSAVN